MLKIDADATGFSRDGLAAVCRHIDAALLHAIVQRLTSMNST